MTNFRVSNFLVDYDIVIWNATPISKSKLEFAIKDGIRNGAFSTVQLDHSFVPVIELATITSLKINTAAGLLSKHVETATTTPSILLSLSGIIHLKYLFFS